MDIDLRDLWKMEGSSLELALRRIRTIEHNFAELNDFARVGVPKKVENFQSVLDTATENVKNATPANESMIDELIGEYSLKNELDKDLVKAIINQESGFQPNVTSKAGAMGLMQLMPGTAAGLGVKNAYDPEENIAGGTKYLKNLLSKYNGDTTKALAAYNAGPNAVAKYNGVPPYMETQNYVKNVLNTYQKYKTQGL